MTRPAELLRITMSEPQIRDACRDFAMARAKIAEPCVVSVELLASIEPDTGIRVEVLFRAKRARKAKGEAK